MVIINTLGDVYVNHRYHSHPYCSGTGSAIPSGDGRHYHEYRTTVQYVDGHIHHIYGRTSAD